jgi:hypothetical protein
MKTMNKFNTHRFADVLLWETIINKRKLAIWALIFFGLIAIPQIVGLIIERGADTIDNTSVIAFLLFSAYLVMGTANIFTNIKSKQERINEFMLPATNQEKFVARYLQTVVAMSLAALIGFFAGDLLQYLLTLAIGQGQQTWATINITNFLKSIHMSWTNRSNGLMYTSTLVFCHLSPCVLPILRQYLPQAACCHGYIDLDRILVHHAVLYRSYIRCTFQNKSFRICHLYL